MGSLRSFKVLSFVVVLKETGPEITVWDGTEPPPRSHIANELIIGISYFCSAVTKLFHKTQGNTRELSPLQQKLQDTQRGIGRGG